MNFIRFPKFKSKLSEMTKMTLKLKAHNFISIRFIIFAGRHIVTDVGKMRMMNQVLVFLFIEFPSLNEPPHESMVLFVLRTLILQTHTQPSNGARCLLFGQTLRLLPYFICANSEGSGETARMRWLA